MSNARDFVAWLIEDVCFVTAEVNTPRDLELKRFERLGFLKFQACFADTNSYEILNVPIDEVVR